MYMAGCLIQVTRLSATGEDALVLTASVHDGSTTQFGSHRAEAFLSKRMKLEQDFLNFCTGNRLCVSKYSNNSAKNVAELCE